MSSSTTFAKFQRNEASLPAIQRDRTRAGLLVRMLSDPPGVTEYSSIRFTVVSVHVGRSVNVACRRGEYRHRGTAVHGDIDIIPAGTPSRWEMNARDTALTLILPPDLLNLAAEELDVEPSRLEIRNQFQVRDAQLENIAWALKAEMESGFPSGRLFLDGMALSVAARLINHHSSAAPILPANQSGRLTARKLKQVISYIEENLADDISLADIAAAAGLSVSHFKRVFRESEGLPVHQYVIRRRLERAKTMLAETGLSISQIALETGFAHQSHLSLHMRRVLGASPGALRAMLACANAGDRAD